MCLNSTELLFAVQGCFVSFFGGVSFFVLVGFFFNKFFIFFVFFYFFFGGEGGSQWLYECTFLHTNLLQSHISKLMYSFYFTYYLCFTAISKLF